ncbi:hypothetical protein FZEAL_5158 [Fusarium zealandicum]|uniref:F-box domain-containing protein n=1 Tax=Fusarium zealandicum TaxID=1053134 RepID=A0A8H4UL34_9HYPO|nr:hypothetical protein FZEAL_5158 [Fusarium zealandicum]
MLLALLQWLRASLSCLWPTGRSDAITTEASIMTEAEYLEKVQRQNLVLSKLSTLEQIMDPIVASSFYNTTYSPIYRLPDEVVMNILQQLAKGEDKLSLFSFFHLRQVSRRFRRLVNDGEFQKHPFSSFNHCKSCDHGTMVAHARRDRDIPSTHCFEHSVSQAQASGLSSYHRKDNLCIECQKMFHLRKKSNQSTLCKFARGHRNDWLVCSDCLMYHPTSAFSLKEQKKKSDRRICIGKEGYIRLCQHVVISWQDIKPLIQSLKQGGDLIKIKVCQDASHTHNCKQANSWPTASLGLSIWTGTYLKLEWQTHTGPMPGQKGGSKQYSARDLRIVTRAIRCKGAEYLCPEQAAGHLPEMECFAFSKGCDCLAFDERLSSRLQPVDLLFFRLSLYLDIHASAVTDIINTASAPGCAFLLSLSGHRFHRNVGCFPSSSTVTVVSSLEALALTLLPLAPCRVSSLYCLCSILSVPYTANLFLFQTGNMLRAIATILVLMTLCVVAQNLDSGDDNDQARVHIDGLGEIAKAIRELEHVIFSSVNDTKRLVAIFEEVAPLFSYLGYLLENLAYILQKLGYVLERFLEVLEKLNVLLTSLTSFSKSLVPEIHMMKKYLAPAFQKFTLISWAVGLSISFGFPARLFAVFGYFRDWADEVHDNSPQTANWCVKTMRLISRALDPISLTRQERKENAIKNQEADNNVNTADSQYLRERARYLETQLADNVMENTNLKGQLQRLQENEIDHGNLRRERDTLQADPDSALESLQVYIDNAGPVSNISPASTGQEIPVIGSDFTRMSDLLIPSIMLRLSFVLVVFSRRLVQAIPGTNIQKTNAEGLAWQPCDLPLPESIKNSSKTPLDCATLQVPLDYTNPKSDKKLDLQLIKVSATEKPVKGSVIFNPGGPGGSGIEEIASNGQTYIDALGGHFDVIGFDARGTGRTMPYLCDLGNGTSDSAGLSRRNNPYAAVPQTDVYSLLEDQVWENSGRYAKACYESNKENSTFYGTAFVARDLLAITDALNEDGLLRFWGRSYSTILGQTFAAMFPDRVGRMLLDSVVVPDDYYTGGWLSATRDTEATLLHFFEECVDAGVELCPLANFTGPDTTAKGLMDATVEVWEELIDDPIMVSKDIGASPWFTTGKLTVYQQSKAAMLSALFYPKSFGGATFIVDLLLNRNFTLFTDPQPPLPPPEEEPWNIGEAYNFHGIACADSTWRSDSPEEMYSLLQAQSAQGSWSDAFSAKVWVCARWPVEAAERYEGPWTGLNTSFPIMLANSRWDPITPLSGAWDAASRWKGSRLLVHEGHGHGIMNHPSNCTIKAVREYFEDGTLPKLGTVCKPNKPAFEQLLEDLEYGKVAGSSEEP